MNHSPRPSTLLELFAASLLFAVLTIFVLPFHLLDRASIFDDAYIHLRIARNLVIHGAPFFNLNDPLIATSAPLWTIFIAILLTLPFDPHSLVGVSGAVGNVLAALTWTGLLRDLSPRTTALTSFFVAIGLVGLCCISSAGLMETPLALFFAAVALRAAMRASPLAGVWIVIGALLRPEIIVFLLPVAVFLWKRSRTRCALAMVFCLLAIAGALLLMLSLFGGIVPHTMVAKRLVYQGSPELLLLALLQSLYGEALPLDEVQVRIAYAGGILVLTLASIALWSRTRMNPSDRPVNAVWILVATLALAGGYLSMKAVLFPWYAPLITVPLSVTILSLVCATPAIVRALTVLWLCMPGVWLLTREYLAIFKSPRWAPLVLSNSRVEQLLKVGKVLDTYLPNARVAAPEIGAIGYQFDGTVLDGVGLATSSALQFHPLPWPSERLSSLVGALPGPFITLERPEIVVGLHAFMSTSALNLLRGSYTAMTIPIYSRVTARSLQNAQYQSGDIWESQQIDVYIRNDIDPPAPMIDELESIR